MSTKNLARTVIEGGRARFNRWERRHSNALERSAERRVSARLTSTAAWDAAIYPARKPVSQSFDDKLGPGRRWLARQIGRPWDRVRSELFARFDTRTTAGRHILFDHLLRDVDLGDLSYSSYARFVVDAHGILKQSARRRYRWPQLERLPEARSVLEAWLGSRRVGERGERCYWFVATDAGAFRQHHELTEAELARWRGLPPGFRKNYQALSTSAED
jgi:hypothetical protein